jgi:multidrug efflux pump subunit AcrB
VIAVFLRNLRGGVVAALAVPLTLGATFLVIALFGQTLNLMSLGGMAVAIGLVIDDAIVIVEAIGRRLEEGAAPREAAEEGTRTMFAAVLGTTATTVVVFIPLAWLHGVVGRFFSALAFTLCVAVVLSFAVAVVVIPLAAARWLPAGTSRPPARYVHAYGRLLSFSVRRRAVGWVLVAVFVALGVVSALEVPTGFLPSMDEGAFVLDYFCPAGTSLADTDRVARKIEAILRQDEDVATFSRRTGAELGPPAATEVSRGDIMVRLRGKGRTRALDDVISDLRGRVTREVPEARTEFLEVLQDVLNDLSGAPRPIEIKLLGEDYGVLRALAKEVAGRIEDVPGLVDLFPGFAGETPELSFRIDPSPPPASAARPPTSRPIWRRRSRARWPPRCAGSIARSACACATRRRPLRRQPGARPAAVVRRRGRHPHLGGGQTRARGHADVARAREPAPGGDRDGRPRAPRPRLGDEGRSAQAAGAAPAGGLPPRDRRPVRRSSRRRSGTSAA